MFISRDIQEKIKLGAAAMPAIGLVGPRQSGKSTLARALFPHHAYLDIQDAELFAFATQDPKGFLQTYAQETHGIIIDEAQYAPGLFGQIKVESDKNPRPGYYVLSGSQNFLLHEKITESLAGRIYLYTLLPLSIHELTQADLPHDDHFGGAPLDYMVRGFYPRLFRATLDPREYYDNYIATYVERDIRAIRNIEHIATFKKFMSLCATRIGCTLNISDLATNCGISVPTVKSWLSLLESSYILFLLPPYHENLGKRVTKSPKLYFYDVGLAAALLGLDSSSIERNRTLYGALFENLTIVDIIKNIYAQGLRPQLMFFRDSNQREVDLIIPVKGSFMPLEIKASQTVQTAYFDTPTWFAQQVGYQEPPVVVYGGTAPQTRSAGRVVPWNQLYSLTQELS